jgi:hypothetical protein
MAIQRKSSAPSGIINASGQPEIVLEIDGLVLSMTPPSVAGASAVPAEPAEPDASAGD